MASQAPTELLKKTRKMARIVQELEDEIKSLQERAARLEAMEVAYLNYKNREPQVIHYLKSFTGVAKENDLLKRQLLALGYEAPRTEWSMKPPTGEELLADAARIRTAGKSRGTAGQHKSSSSSRKRTHEEFDESEISDPRLTCQQDDRDIMPPPRFQSRVPPFFRRMPVTPVAPMQTPRGVRNQLQTEQFVSGARNYRMAPASPIEIGGQSLNSLSFINSPYTNGNQPIFSGQDPQQTRAFSISHRRNSSVAEPDFFSRHNERPFSHYTAAEPTRVTLLGQNFQRRQDLALPPRSERTFTRDDDWRLLSTIRGAKSGSGAANYAYGRPVGKNPPPPVVPLARKITTAGSAMRMSSSGGRRVVRR